MSVIVSVGEWCKSLGMRHGLVAIATSGVAVMLMLEAYKSLKPRCESPHFPGPNILQLLPMARLSPQEGLKYLINLADKFGDIFSFWSPTGHTVVVADMAAYKEVASKRLSHFSCQIYDNFLDMINIATVEGDLWKRHKRFSSRRLAEAPTNRSLKMICSIAQELVRRVQATADSSGTISYWDPVDDLHIAASTVSTAAFMKEANPLSCGDPIYSPTIQEGMIGVCRDAISIAVSPSHVFYRDRFLCRLFFPPVRKFYERWRGMRKTLKEAIERNRIRQATSVVAEDLDQDEQIDTLLIYCLAGGESTAATIDWILYNLCLYKNVQDLARAEADSLDKDPDSFEDIQRLPYIRACVLETMRVGDEVATRSSFLVNQFDAVIPVTMTRASQDFTLPSGTIRASSHVLLALGRMMWLGYEEGHRFCPERWLDERTATLDQSKCSDFIGFGYGPRKCPGEHLALNEAVITIAVILRNFTDLRLVEGAQIVSKLTSPVTSVPGNLAISMECRRPIK